MEDCNSNTPTGVAGNIVTGPNTSRAKGRMARSAAMVYREGYAHGEDTWSDAQRMSAQASAYEREARGADAPGQGGRGRSY